MSASMFLSAASEEDGSNLKAVEKTMKADFRDEGCCYGDAAWRDVSVCSNNRETKVAVFNIESAGSDKGQNNHCIETAVACLFEKLNYFCDKAHFKIA